MTSERTLVPYSEVVEASGKIQIKSDEFLVNLSTGSFALELIIYDEHFEEILNLGTTSLHTFLDEVLKYSKNEGKLKDIKGDVVREILLGIIEKLFTTGAIDNIEFQWHSKLTPSLLIEILQRMVRINESPNARVSLNELLGDDEVIMFDAESILKSNVTLLEKIKRFGRFEGKQWARGAGFFRRDPQYSYQELFTLLKSKLEKTKSDIVAFEALGAFIRTKLLNFPRNRAESRERQNNNLRELVISIQRLIGVDLDVIVEAIKLPDIDIHSALTPQKIAAKSAGQIGFDTDPAPAHKPVQLAVAEIAFPWRKNQQEGVLHDSEKPEIWQEAVAQLDSLVGNIARLAVIIKEFRSRPGSYQDDAESFVPKKSENKLAAQTEQISDAEKEVASEIRTEQINKMRQLFAKVESDLHKHLKDCKGFINNIALYRKTAETSFIPETILHNENISDIYKFLNRLSSIQRSLSEIFRSEKNLPILENMQGEVEGIKKLVRELKDMLVMISETYIEMYPYELWTDEAENLKNYYYNSLNKQKLPDQILLYMTLLAEAAKWVGYNKNYQSMLMRQYSRFLAGDMKSLFAKMSQTQAFDKTALFGRRMRIIGSTRIDHSKVFDLD